MKKNPNADKTKKYRDDNYINHITDMDFKEMEECGYTIESIATARAMQLEGFCLPKGPTKSAMEYGDKFLGKYLKLVKEGMDPYEAFDKLETENKPNTSQLIAAIKESLSEIEKYQKRVKQLVEKL